MMEVMGYDVSKTTGNEVYDLILDAVPNLSNKQLIRKIPARPGYYTLPGPIAQYQNETRQLPWFHFLDFDLTPPLIKKRIYRRPPSSHHHLDKKVSRLRVQPV